MTSPYGFQCSVCCSSKEKQDRYQVFYPVDHLKAHITTVHSVWIPFECVLCPMMFMPTEAILQHHYQQIHPGKVPKAIYTYEEKKKQNVKKILTDSLQMQTCAPTEEQPISTVTATPVSSGRQTSPAMSVAPQTVDKIQNEKRNLVNTVPQPEVAVEQQSPIVTTPPAANRGKPSREKVAEKAPVPTVAPKKPTNKDNNNDKVNTGAPSLPTAKTGEPISSSKIKPFQIRINKPTTPVQPENSKRKQNDKEQSTITPHPTTKAPKMTEQPKKIATTIEDSDSDIEVLPAEKEEALGIQATVPTSLELTQKATNNPAWCNVCQKAVECAADGTTDKSAHIWSQHMTSGRFRCNNCGRQTNSVELMKEHQRRERHRGHTDAEQTRTAVYKRKYTAAFGAFKDNDTKQTKEAVPKGRKSKGDRDKCKLCSRRTDDKPQHIRRHHMAPAYRCQIDQCRFRLYQWNEREAERHLAQQHPGVNRIVSQTNLMIDNYGEYKELMKQAFGP